MANADIIISNAWGSRDLQEKVLGFWQQLQALPPNIDPQQRVRQLVYVALLEDHVIGVTTASEMQIAQLNNRKFFSFRSLIHPAHRRPGLLDKLTLITRDFLESLYLEHKTECIGMVTIIENKDFKRHKTHAVLPSSGLTYIGNTKEGADIRIYYFKGARIT